MSKHDHIYRARAKRFKELKAARRRKARAAARETAWQGVGVLILAGMVLGIGWGMLEGVELNEMNETKGNVMLDYGQSELSGLGGLDATSDDYALGCFGDAGARAFPVCGVVVRETLEGVTLLDVSDGWFEAYAVHVDGEFTPWIFDDFETALDWYWGKVKLGEDD